MNSFNVACLGSENKYIRPFPGLALSLRSMVWSNVYEEMDADGPATGEQWIMQMKIEV